MLAAQVFVLNAKIFPSVNFLVPPKVTWLLSYLDILTNSKGDQSCHEFQEIVSCPEISRILPRAVEVRLLFHLRKQDSLW